MCLIVDANLGNLVFSPTPPADFIPIWHAIMVGRARAVHGGHLSVEYAKLSKVAQRLLSELARQGKVYRADDAAVEKATIDYKQRAIQSDDEHILGLAHVSGVRLLCSHDVALHADFTNPALLQPVGSIYQTSGHAHLITRHCSKPGSKRQKRTRQQKS